MKLWFFTYNLRLELNNDNFFWNNIYLYKSGFPKLGHHRNLGKWGQNLKDIQYTYWVDDKEQKKAIIFLNGSFKTCVLNIIEKKL